MASELSPVFDFLTELKNNNDRSWFNDHKDRYEKAHKSMIHFAEALLAEMQTHDNISTISGKKSLYRIYRDVRFSKNKMPYKSSWSGSFKRATASLRGGYYYHLEPGNSFLAGGFFNPNPADLKHIRNQITQDDGSLREVLASEPLKSYFGGLGGNQVKTAPKGFTKDDPAIDLLRYKQFVMTHHFSDREVLSKDFHLKLSDGFRKLRPFFDLMSDYLTTDLNGASTV